MAEERFHNYRRPVDSFAENRRVLGIIEPGIYRGFDVFTPGVGLAFTLGHGTKGIVQTNANNTTQTVAKGVLVTRHGGVVQEDAAVALTLTTNTANTEDRYDLIIFEHQWLASVGGQAGVYSIIQGPNADPSLPVLTNPKIQIALGYIKIPAGSILASDCTWTRYAPKGLGGTNVALLDEANSFTGLQSHAWATASFVVYPGTTKALEWDMTKNHVLIPVTLEEFFECMPIAADGTRILVGYSQSSYTLPTLHVQTSSIARLTTGGILETHAPIIGTGSDPTAGSAGQRTPFRTSTLKYGYSFVEFVFRKNTPGFTRGAWNIVSAGDRSLELSNKPSHIQSGDWVSISALNAVNGSKLDTGTTLGELSVKYVGLQLYLQGKVFIKIMTATLGAFQLPYPNTTTQGTVIWNSVNYICKPIKILNITSGVLVDGVLYIYRDYMTMSLATGIAFQVGSTYCIFLAEHIMLDQL
jgi:hypothetical protein